MKNRILLYLFGLIVGSASVLSPNTAKATAIGSVDAEIQIAFDFLFNNGVSAYSFDSWIKVLGTMGTHEMYALGVAYEEAAYRAAHPYFTNMITTGSWQLGDGTRLAVEVVKNNNGSAYVRIRQYAPHTGQVMRTFQGASKLRGIIGFTKFIRSASMGMLGIILSIPFPTDLYYCVLSGAMSSQCGNGTQIIASGGGDADYDDTGTSSSNDPYGNGDPVDHGSGQPEVYVGTPVVVTPPSENGEEDLI